MVYTQKQLNCTQTGVAANWFAWKIRIKFKGRQEKIKKT